MKWFKLFDSSELKKLILPQADGKAHFEMHPVLNSGWIEKYLPLRAGGAAVQVFQEGIKFYTILIDN